MSRMVCGSLALSERCRCVPSFSSPKHHLILNTLDPRFCTYMLCEESSLTARVVPPVRIGDSSLIFGNTCITET